jgi:hypothetical protein
MKMVEKKKLVLAFLSEALEKDEAISDFLKGYRAPTDIGMVALGTDLFAGSSKASPVCKALVAEGLLERHPKGWYRISKKGISHVKLDYRILE